LTDLEDLVKTGNITALEEMLKDLEMNKEKEIHQAKERFDKKRKPIVEALSTK